MHQNFLNLPEGIESILSGLMSPSTESIWLASAEKLHNRYMARDKKDSKAYIEDDADVLAYIAMRVPATYAQIASAFGQIREMIPSWKPTTLLDIGCGPGTGLWAATASWPTIQSATCIDSESHFLDVARGIYHKMGDPIPVIWKKQNLSSGLGLPNQKYDLVILASVLNELPEQLKDKVIAEAYAQCTGVLLILEPGTPYGFQIIQAASKKFVGVGELIAPYIQNSFVESTEYWLHFPQRFIRPEFQRRVRQAMRGSNLMASDWEETKYSYTAIGKVPTEKIVFGRCVGEIEKYNGYLEISILTQSSIEQLKVLKRNKEEYDYAKNLHWGEVIQKKRV